MSDTIISVSSPGSLDSPPPPLLESSQARSQADPSALPAMSVMGSSSKVIGALREATVIVVVGTEDREGDERDSWCNGVELVHHSSVLE